MSTTDQPAAERIKVMAGNALALWLTQFGVAIYASLVANLLFGIPLGNVVDVLLALGLFAPVFIAGVYVVVSVLARDFSDFGDFLIDIIPYALSPFAATLGYSLYAYFAGTNLWQVSFVYAGFMQHVADALRDISHAATSHSIPVAWLGSQQFFSWSNFLFSAAGLLLSFLTTRLRFREADRR